MRRFRNFRRTINLFKRSGFRNWFGERRLSGHPSRDLRDALCCALRRSRIRGLGTAFDVSGILIHAHKVVVPLLRHSNSADTQNPWSDLRSIFSEELAMLLARLGPYF